MYVLFYFLNFFSSLFCNNGRRRVFYRWLLWKVSGRSGLNGYLLRHTEQVNSIFAHSNSLEKRIFIILNSNSSTETTTTRSRKLCICFSGYDEFSGVSKTKSKANFLHSIFVLFIFLRDFFLLSANALSVDHWI